MRLCTRSDILVKNVNYPFLFVTKLDIFCLQFEVYSREHLSRKTSLEDNLGDVLNRQHMAGDPGVRLYDRQV